MIVDGWDAAVGPMRAVATTMDSSLSARDAEQISELIDVGEPGNAFEILCTQLHAYGVVPDRRILRMLSPLGTYFELDPDLWGRFERP